MHRATLVGAILLALAGPAYAQQYIPAMPSGDPPATTAFDLNSPTYNPAVVPGDPNGTPPVTPADRVDLNVASSFAAGVVSVFFDVPPVGGVGTLCSGTLVSPHHVLTAAHCLDLDDNGLVDILPASSTVVFNHTGSFAAARGIAAIDVHPDYTGFNNPSINDDLAILTLDSPAPAGVPIYPLNNDPFITAELITMAGYGESGNGVEGFTVAPALDVKRGGQNVASVFDLDDEGSGSREVFFFDFDGPELTTSTLDALPTLGNNIETTIGPGDSGGPSFLWTDTGDAIPQADEMVLFGVNTFNAGGGPFPEAPLFGSLGGGMIVSTYQPWIDSIIPEPQSMAMLALGGLALLRRRS